MKNTKFIHLNVHSDYSITNGLSKIDTLLQKTSLLNMPAIALTDCTNLFGFIKFFNKAQFLGIKPIIGADFFIYSSTENNKINRLTLLAKNVIGYQNLIKLISKSYRKGYDPDIGPTIKRKWLLKIQKGLILLSGGLNGDIGENFLSNKINKSLEYIKFYKKYFPDNFYLEIFRFGKEKEKKYLEYIVDISEKYKLPIVATNEVRFANTENFFAHEIRILINQGKILKNQKNKSVYSKQQYLKSEEEMYQMFSDIPESLINSVEIAKRCNLNLKLGKYFLPYFPTGINTPENFLVKKSKIGLRKRLFFIFQDKKTLISQYKIYYKRLLSELKIINLMGFPSYFLIVMEFINWAKKNKIPVGPGRGSGAGSLVAYALNITDVNPLKFDLIFERFLNIERVSMPDFDIDFCMNRRDEVIDHVSNIYGEDAVSQIITFGKMTAKSVIRDVGRTLGYNYRFVDFLSKLIPNKIGINLQKALKHETKLQKIYDTNEDVKTLINMSMQLEGTIRNASKHAGGVVISPTKIINFSPIYCDENGKNIVTQFDKNDIEKTGLVKFDFLGLKTLTIIHQSILMINKKLSNLKKDKINISKIPLNDKKSFFLLQKSKTTAVFQLESYGIKNLIKRLQPDCFEDIIALIALFRPGPLQSGMVDNFINRKHGREKIFFPDKDWEHDLLKPILKSTYGIILYQEQVMKIAQVFAGYSLGQADILRRAMSKKQPEEMSKERKKFLKGSKKRGIKNSLALKIFNIIEKFAGYGFNKSHSTAYALISYQTLWLKTNYPEEFMSSAISNDMDNIDKVILLIKECWNMKLKILKPDINISLYHFYVHESNCIIYGLGAIKGIGKNTVDTIIESRNKQGNFKGLLDLCMRNDITNLNKKILEQLISSGSLDCFTKNRALLFNILQETIKISDQKKKAENTQQFDMFTLDNINENLFQNIKIIPWPNQIKLYKEYETLGLYFSDHPMNQYIYELERYVNITRIKKLFIQNDKNLEKTFVTAGILINLYTIKNKINVLILEDNKICLDLFLQEEIKKKYNKFLKKNTVIIIYGKIDTKYKKFIVYKISNIDQERKKYVKKLILLISKNFDNKKILYRIKKVLNTYRKGQIPVYIYYIKNNNNIKIKLGISWKILPNENLLTKLKSILGEKQVILKYI